MDAKFNIAINWYLTQQARGITYSMTSRFGPNSFDCSSAGYFSLEAAGLLPAGLRIGNTDTMFRDFEANGWVQIKPNAQGNYDTRKGDAAIWGKRGASGGAAGHYMFFIDADRVINCRVAGIKIDNYDQLRAWNDYPEQTFYRYAGSDAPGPVGNPTDQNVDVGSFIKFADPLTVSKVELQGGLWQVLSNDLCPVDPTWDDNGVPAEPLVEVDADGYATDDQDLNPGSRFVLPGKHQVLDLGQSGGMWLALIQWNVYKFWVDIAKATEVAGTDGGTPVPGKRPSVAAPQPAPAEQPAPETPPAQQPAEEPAAQPEPEQPPADEPEPAQQPTKEPTTNEPAKEPTKMAFSEAEQKQLQVATQSAQKLADDVQASDVVAEIQSGISKKTKVIVYVVGDSLIGLGLVAPGLAVVLGFTDLIRIVALSGLLATAGAFILTMFGIYKSKQ
ncbi:peptidoglycan amidohydrolase family protein [Curtobacterium sp. MCSS17_007]|uniref:peptidoglycan amidohydrolase family protein n=1 Tax=Curtobacterium sp. MCSS17_007 TaxID=2175646 RepID=UPI000DA91A42|nr:peptidoglycan amidohydrolase family protein [Curtobacterium sp. MCSS17_007]WIE74472.1 peptidoglycan amidohydrolase family protein [Curtobacterium sp. MCSS17_007]